MSPSFANRDCGASSATHVDPQIEPTNKRSYENSVNGHGLQLGTRAGRGVCVDETALIPIESFDGRPETGPGVA